MTKSKPLNDDEKQLFQQAVKGIKPLQQDTIPQRKITSGKTLQAKKKPDAKQRAEFYFSDEFEPLLEQQGAMKYVKPGVDSYLVKCLRRGDYVPELTLDLHGLNLQQTKRELAALLVAAQKEHCECLCIVHGIGSRTLKAKIPHYLVQHPDVLAFHQAPLEFGGDGALLVIIDLKDKSEFTKD